MWEQKPCLSSCFVEHLRWCTLSVCRINCCERDSLFLFAISDGRVVAREQGVQGGIGIRWVPWQLKHISALSCGIMWSLQCIFSTHALLITDTVCIWLALPKCNYRVGCSRCSASFHFSDVVSVCSRCSANFHFPDVSVICFVLQKCVLPFLISCVVSVLQPEKRWHSPRPASVGQ